MAAKPPGGHTARFPDVSERMHERFRRLCEIPSITEDERAVQDAIAAELRGLGYEVSEDDAAGPARAGAGNLTCRVDPAGDGDVPWTMFAAHVDTVPHPGTIEVVERDGVFYSAGDTILGADNKAAVTVLMEMAALWAEDDGPPAGVELLFTVAEEQGLRGAHAFDVSTLRADTGFVLDHATPIGEIVVAAPTYKKLIADFRGVEAHAGLQPEAGRNAIEAASAAIAAMELGRLDPETTANVGLIEGGSAPNVVAGGCRITAEARAIELERVQEVAMAMVEACQWAAGEHSCDVDVQIDENFRGYRVKPGAKSLAIARAALSACGVEPQERSTGGGSDANAFRLHGFDALLLANGTKANHTADESVSRADARAHARRLPGSGRRGGAVLKLRRGLVLEADPLTVEVDGEHRRAWADEGLVGPCEPGDEVIVNTAALDLGLGSGGFDVVHVNLTRGLQGGGSEPGRARDEAQLHVAAARGRAGRGDGRGGAATTGSAGPGPRPPPARAPRAGRMGVRPGGGGGPQARVRADPGGGAERLAFARRRRAARARAARGDDQRRPLLRRRARGDQRCRGPARGGDRARLGCDRRGPGAGHPRLRQPVRTRRARGARGRPRGPRARPARAALSAPVRGRRPRAPPRAQPPHRDRARAAARRRRRRDPDLGRELWPDPPQVRQFAGPIPHTLALALGELHEPVPAVAEVEAYAESGLPRRTMGRDLAEDELFFAAPLAAGAALAGMLD